ncbi:MAG: Hsp33 family molecular chaperone HslO [Pseudomonadota bacterium]
MPASDRSAPFAGPAAPSVDPHASAAPAPLSSQPGDDEILPFQLDRSDIRGRAARLDATLGDILGKHDYPPIIAGLAAEAALITALIGQTLKLRWRLSLQVRGDGPIRLIATDWFAPKAEGEPAHMRAYAGFDAEALDPAKNPFEQIGKGYFAVVIDQGAGMRPYQGMTPIAGGSLAACAETYFAQSEQIATRFALASAEAGAPGEAPSWRAGGVMLQHLPPASPLMPGEGGSGEDGLLTAHDVAEMGENGEDWTRANLLLDTVETHELLGPHVDPSTLLLRLFHEERPRVWPAQPVRFGCTCSAEKVVAALHQYSAKDIASMTTVEGVVTADCQFCGAHYRFDPATLGFEAERPNDLPGGDAPSV